MLPYRANPANQIDDFTGKQSHNFLKWQILGIYKLNGRYICTASDVPEKHLV